MQADQPARLFQTMREVFEPDARCVRRENRIVLHARFDRAVELALRVRVLEDRFDDHVRARDAVAFEIRH